MAVLPYPHRLVLRFAHTVSKVFLRYVNCVMGADDIN